MDNKTKGIALIIGALILAAIVYALRPPSGFGEAMMRVSQNPNALFLKPPIYYGGLIASAVLALFGVLKLNDANDKE